MPNLIYGRGKLLKEADRKQLEASKKFYQAAKILCQITFNPLEDKELIVVWEMLRCGCAALKLSEKLRSKHIDAFIKYIMKGK